MSELSEYIKKLREEKGITIEQICDETKISPKVLSALENDQFELLPPDVYVRGILKTLANYFGVSADELYQKFIEAKKETPKKAKQPKRINIVGDVSALPETVEEHKVTMHDVWHSLRAVPVIIYIIGFIIILAGIIIVVSISRKETPPSYAIEAVSPDTLIHHMAKAPYDHEIAQEIRISIDSVNPARALARAESLTFVVRAREPVDLYVERDYKLAFKGKLGTGQTKVWRVKDAIYMESSNPGALKISVNGFDLAPLNIPYGQPIDLRRDNILQYIEGYQPLPPGISSAYGQRIEAAAPESLKTPKPPPEKPVKKKRPKTRSKTTTKKETQQKSTRPRIIPPKTRKTIIPPPKGE